MSTKRISHFSSVKLRIGIIIICFLTSVVSRYINFNWIILVFFSLYFLILLWENLVFAIKYFPLVIGVGMVITSTFIIEYKPIYLVELDKISNYSGALPLIVGYYLLFMMVLELNDKKYAQKKLNTITDIASHSFYKSKFAVLILNLSGYAILILIATMLFRIANLSSPFFISHLDRYAFKKIYINDYKIWRKFDSYFIYFIPILIINWKMGKKKINILNLILYFIYNIWMGCKYTELRMIVFVWMLPFFYSINNQKINRVREWCKKYIYFFAFIFVLIYLSYSFLVEKDIIDTFSQRLAQQGQLWWSIYTQQNHQSNHLTELSDELSAFSKIKTATPYYGIYKIMYLCAPKEVVTAKIATGSSYTESTAASIYYYFGKFAGPLILIIFAILIGKIFAFLVQLYTKYVNEGRAIEAVISVRFVINFFGFLGSGRIEHLFSIASIFTMLLLSLCEYIISTNKKRSNLNFRLIDI